MRCPACQAELDEETRACPACQLSLPSVHAAEVALDPDDVLLVVREFLLGLAVPDRVTLFGAVAMFLACFFPWAQSAREGAVLGLMSSGVLVFLLSLGAAALLVLRVRHTGHRRDPFLLWLLQLAPIGAASLVCVLHAAASLDLTLVPGAAGEPEVWVSRPSFGVILAFLACLVAGAGTLASLKARR